MRTRPKASATASCDQGFRTLGPPSLVKDVIERRTDGRHTHAEPLDAFAEELDRLGYGNVPDGLQRLDTVGDDLEDR